MNHSLRQVTEHDFDNAVLKSPLPVLVEFGAAWCPPCRVVEPILERIATQRAGHVNVVQIDADTSAAIAARYRVRALPTIISFAAGVEHKRHVGAASADLLLGLLPAAEPKAASAG